MFAHFQQLQETSILALTSALPSLVISTVLCCSTSRYLAYII
jgi:hypothetical protein